MASPLSPHRIPHDRARDLRRNQTEAEKRLWARLRDGQIYDVKFRRQFPIGEFIADFACPAAHLAIELDGAQHAEQTEKDQWRTRLLAEHGYRVLRFWNEEVMTNIEGVLEKIIEELLATGVVGKEHAS
ncbi:MAG: endonuclease domain-containing protein [Candidatus Binataceae bacterium]